jgi:hypothetical protein
MKKNLSRLGVAVALAATAIHSNAALTFAESIAPPAIYTAPLFATATPALAYVATDSVGNVRLAPLGASASYLVVSAGGSATVGLGGASSFEFLWGSPDKFNSIEVSTSLGTETFTGSDFQSQFSIPANGSNSSTRLFSILAGRGEALNSITFASSGIAFELATVSPVPEPGTGSQLLAGLLAVAYLGRRTLFRSTEK